MVAFMSPRCINQVGEICATMLMLQCCNATMLNAEDLVEIECHLSIRANALLRAYMP